MVSTDFDRLALSFLELHEGKESRMYLDSANIATIGVGHRIRPSEPYLHTANLSDSEIQAYLSQDLSYAKKAVEMSIQVELNVKQKVALTSLAFNIGVGAFQGSTLVRMINSAMGQSEITKWWLVWNKITLSGQKVVSKGLAKRRQKEVELYFS
jgi:lysozyme